MAYEIKELGVGGILDQAITLVRDHFGLLFGIIAVAFLPLSLLINLFNVYMMPPAPTVFTQEAIEAYSRAAQSAQIYAIPLSLLLAFIVLPITNSAIVWAVARLYLGQPTSLGNAFGRAFRLFLPIVFTSFLYYLVMMLGFVLCIIPGFIFMFWFFLQNHIVVIEGIWGPKALSRSRALAKGSYSTLFVLLFMMFIIQLALGLAANVMGQSIVQAVVASIVGSILVVLYAAVFVVFYFSCRCKVENFDLNILAESVATES